MNSTSKYKKHTIKMLNTCNWNRRRKGERLKDRKKKELRNSQNSLKVKDIQLQIQEAQYTPNKTNTKKISPRHIVVKLLKIKDKEKNL